MKQPFTFSFAIALLSLFARPAQAQWTNQCENLLEAGTWVEVLRVVDAQTVWATIDNSAVYAGADSLWLPRIAHTTDGGQSWQLDSIPGTQGFMAMGLAALSADTVWISLFNRFHPDKNRLYRTTDAGVHWQQQYQEDSIAGLGIHFFDAQNGLIFRGSQVRITHDGGAHWQAPAVLPAALNLNIFNYGGDSYAAWQNNVWIPLGDGHVLKTTDRGEHWALQSTPLVGDTVSFNCLAFADADHGLALGIFANATYATLLPSRVFSTDNGGNSWTEVPAANLPPVGLYVVTEAVPGSNTTFVLSDADPLTYASADYITHDNGLSWQILANSTPQIREVYGFASPSVGWSGNGFSFVPNDAMFFKWNGDALVGAPVQNAPAFDWEQMPNPAQDWLYFNFPATVAPGEVTVSVFDANHRRLLTRFGASALDIRKLPAGIYYTIVQNGQHPAGVKRWVKM